VPPTKGNINRLQAKLRQLARIIYLTASPFADDKTVDIEGGIPHALYSIIRARLGMLLSLRLTPHQDAPAAVITRNLVGYHGRSNMCSWAAETTRFLQRFTNLGAGPYDDIRAILALDREPHLGDVALAAKVFARRALCAQLKADFMAANGDSTTHITSLAQRPPLGEGPVKQGHALAFSYYHLDGLLGNLSFTPRRVLQGTPMRRLPPPARHHPLGQGPARCARNAAPGSDSA